MNKLKKEISNKIEYLLKDATGFTVHRNIKKFCHDFSGSQKILRLAQKGKKGSDIAAVVSILGGIYDACGYVQNAFGFGFVPNSTAISHRTEELRGAVSYLAKKLNKEEKEIQQYFEHTFKTPIYG